MNKMLSLVSIEQLCLHFSTYKQRLHHSIVVRQFKWFFFSNFIESAPSQFTFIFSNLINQTKKKTTSQTNNIHTENHFPHKSNFWIKNILKRGEKMFKKKSYSQYSVLQTFSVLIRYIFFECTFYKNFCV